MVSLLGAALPTGVSFTRYQTAHEYLMMDLINASMIRTAVAGDSMLKFRRAVRNCASLDLAFFDTSLAWWDHFRLW